MMNKEEILLYLEENKDLRGIRHWEKTGVEGMSSVGIGMTRLKTLARKIGKNHKLAMELWQIPVFECKILSTLLDDPAVITEEQINRQVKDLNFWMLSHAYCNYLLPKYPFVKTLAEDWHQSPENLHKRCGYQLYYQIAKNDKKLSNEYFLPIVSKIENELQRQENFVKDAMNNALCSIGMRNKELNDRCIQAAKNIGKVYVDYGDNSCQAIDVISHLTSDRIQKKFG